MRFNWIPALLLAGLIAGCAGPRADAYREEKPVLDLKTYFDGDIDAWSMFQKRSGGVARRFTVDIKASWDGDVDTLEEDFVYSDGETSRRVWTIRKLDQNTHVGTADDVIGEARGEAFGNALRWRHILALEVERKDIPCEVRRLDVPDGR